MNAAIQLVDMMAVGVFAISGALPIAESLAMPVAIGLAFALRASAILFDLRLPKYGR